MLIWISINKMLICLHNICHPINGAVPNNQLISKENSILTNGTIVIWKFETYVHIAQNKMFLAAHSLKQDIKPVIKSLSPQFLTTSFCTRVAANLPAGSASQKQIRLHPLRLSTDVTHSHSKKCKEKTNFCTLRHNQKLKICVSNTVSTTPFLGHKIIFLMKIIISLLCIFTRISACCWCNQIVHLLFTRKQHR